MYGVNDAMAEYREENELLKRHLAILTDRHQDFAFMTVSEVRKTLREMRKEEKEKEKQKIKKTAFDLNDIEQRLSTCDDPLVRRVLITEDIPALIDEVKRLRK